MRLWLWPPVQERHNLQSKARAPLWDGGPLSGTLLIAPLCSFHKFYAGLGDQIEAARYIPHVARHVGRVKLGCSRELRTLFATLAGVDDVFPLDREWPASDACLLSYDLVSTLRLDIRDPRFCVPYVRPPDGATVHLGDAAGLRVGLAWAASRDFGRERSCPLEAFAPLLAVPGVTFYSLQVGLDAEDLVRSGLAITDLSPQLRDVGDTAAAIAQLDLVITVDTMVAHLGGALGKPVWIMTTPAADLRWCWCWGMEGDDLLSTNRFYPSASLFRLKRPGEWGDTIGRVKTALASLVSATLQAHGTPPLFLVDRR